MLTAYGTPNTHIVPTIFEAVNTNIKQVLPLDRIHYKLQMVHSSRVKGYNFQLKFLSLKIISVLANSADPDEMTCCAAFHLGLNCLPKGSYSNF